MLKVTKSFLNEILWPEFVKYSKLLEELVKDIVNNLITKIHEDDLEEAVIAEPISLT